MLSDKEKQEIIRCIEGNRPLPDKYRWILFDANRRQVELVCVRAKFQTVGGEASERVHFSRRAFENHKRRKEQGETRFFP